MIGVVWLLFSVDLDVKGRRSNRIEEMGVLSKKRFRKKKFSSEERKDQYREKLRVDAEERHFVILTTCLHPWFLFDPVLNLRD